MKLSTKMVTLSIASVAIASLLLLFVGERTAETAMTSLITRHSTGLAHSIANDLDRFLFERYENIRSWSRLDVFRVLAGSAGDLEGELSAFLADMKRTYSFFDLLLAARVNLDSDRVESATDLSYLGKPTPDSFWFSRDPAVSFGGEVLGGDLQEYRPGEPRVIFRAAIRDGTESVGILVALVDPSSMADSIRDAMRESDSDGNAATVLVLTHDNRLVTGIGPLAAGLRAGRPAFPVDAGGNGALVRDGKTYRVFRAVSTGYRSFPGFGWRTVVLYPDAVIREPLAAYARRAAGAGIAVALLSALLSGGLIRGAFKPLDRLIGHMQSVSRAADETPPDLPALTGSGEIARLNDAYLHMLRGLRERDVIKSAFRRYLSGDLVQQILADGGPVELTGLEADVTVLFMDARDFTRISESMEPREIVRTLNAYFTRIVEIVFRHRGMLDKYIGDCVMCVWGCPVPRPDDHLNAVRAAVEIRAALETMNAGRESAGEPVFRFGIGLSSGKVIAGNIGSPERMDYTVIGDPVNLASRLESLTKEYKKPILVSESCHANVAGRVRSEYLGQIPIRGRKEPMGIYALHGMAEE